MSDLEKNSAATYSEEQIDLFKKWVEHFGAVDAKELDLGMQMAIHEMVLDGLTPSDPGQGRPATSVG